MGCLYFLMFSLLVPVFQHFISFLFFLFSLFSSTNRLPFTFLKLNGFILLCSILKPWHDSEILYDIISKPILFFHLFLELRILYSRKYPTILRKRFQFFPPFQFHLLNVKVSNLNKESLMFMYVLFVIGIRHVLFSSCNENSKTRKTTVLKK